MTVSLALSTISMILVMILSRKSTIFLAGLATRSRKSKKPFRKPSVTCRAMNSPTTLFMRDMDTALADMAFPNTKCSCTRALNQASWACASGVADACRTYLTLKKSWPTGVT